MCVHPSSGVGFENLDPELMRFTEEGIETSSGKCVHEGKGYGGVNAKAVGGKKRSWYRLVERLL